LLGYKHVLEGHEIAFREELIFNGGFKEEGGFAAMHQILHCHPEVTAVLIDMLEKLKGNH
jgi:LacI family transcriptional regulator